MEDITIRRAGPGDLNTLQDISRKTFSETFSENNSDENMKSYMEEAFSSERLRTELTNKGSEFYFAVLNHEVIGYLKLNTGQSQTEIQDDKALEIERIYV